jgi:hypothetical protein
MPDDPIPPVPPQGWNEGNKPKPTDEPKEKPEDKSETPATA